jgi:23S rRNA pseudouridine1911/1915/1917 synthase
MKKHRTQGRHGSSNPQRNAQRPGAAGEVRVLYEDGAVVVLDKPAGLLSVPIKGSAVPSALSLLTAELKTRRQRAFIVHRIDRFASGILLFAKTAADRRALVAQFLAHTPGREYLAVVRGHMEKPAGTLVHYFRRDGFAQQLSTERDRKAARAELHYRVEESLADASLVRVELVTGLQNQIRAQFAAIGHALIGDRKYHPAEASETRIDRVALHAGRLEFEHPRSRERVAIESPLPQDMRRLMRELHEDSQ